MKISLVMPAYNEEKNIGNVLQFVITLSNIDEILVVNDGSTDNTASICKQFKTIRFINLEKNIGKTLAVQEGINQAKNDHILLFDADLIGLKHIYIQNLIQNYQNGYDMVIMDYGDMDWFRHDVIKGITALSGVRILHKSHFKHINFMYTNSFELETRINEYFLRKKMKIGYIEAPTVRTPFKFEKYNFFIGFMKEIIAIKQYIFINGLSGLPKLLISWNKIYTLRIKT